MEPQHWDNHAIRMVTDKGEVRTLAGNGEAGFGDLVWGGARFIRPVGLGLLPTWTWWWRTRATTRSGW